MSDTAKPKPDGVTPETEDLGAQDLDQVSGGTSRDWITPRQFEPSAGHGESEA